MAGQTGGIVMGTGDLSELALGWCTYNGDHMSMYGVNACVPKTLIRWMMQRLRKCRLLRPPRTVLQGHSGHAHQPGAASAGRARGRLHRQPEDLVGPYALHDFFLYYVGAFRHAPPAKLYDAGLVGRSRGTSATRTVLKKWLKNLLSPVLHAAVQAQTACPDGVKVGSGRVEPAGRLADALGCGKRVMVEGVREAVSRETAAIQEKMQLLYAAFSLTNRVQDAMIAPLFRITGKDGAGICVDRRWKTLQ